MRKIPAIALILPFLLALAPAAASVDALRGKLETARTEAGALAGQIGAAQASYLEAAAEAEVARVREQRLAGLLATGEQRAAAIGAEVEEGRERLALERQRLRRARQALAQRLVEIYKSGLPNTLGVILGAGDFADLATRTEYLERIEDSDTALAERIADVRVAVARDLERIEELKARVDRQNERLAAARAEIGAARASAEETAAQLGAATAARKAALASLKAKIGGWVRQIERAEAASRAEAEEVVGRWLGGPYSIPTYIVMCESGGNYSALNPSSGAGGAYQIIPSTWAAYGGKGAPHLAPKAEQDRIAAEIWADSGGSAWVCAG